MNRSYNKVFCVGWHKTGTTTLGEALLVLGYKVVGARLDLAEPLLKGDLDCVIDEAKKFQAFQDVPWAALYKELDTAFPGSKFILTIRDERAWLTSALKHFGANYTAMREWLYGVGVMNGNEETYLKRFQTHNEAVKAYFKDRPEDLLVMSLADGDGWEKLCPFLGCEVPGRSFPHANKGKHNYDFTESIYNTLRGTIPVKIRRKILDMLGFEDRTNRFNNKGKNRSLRP